jgi:hypothetical protein
MNTMTREQELDAFVGRELYACQSSLIEEALRKNIFSVDEIYNVYRPFDGKLIDPSVCVRCKMKYPFLDSETGECENALTRTKCRKKFMNGGWFLHGLGKSSYLKVSQS